MYAEIDIITTALNLDTTNTQLGKMGNGKYLVKGTTDYLTKLNNLLKDKFGINTEEKEKIIPKEYSLHQNYPNPFNPITTIGFNLQEDGIVKLTLYNILGQELRTLVNEYKESGVHTINFDASDLKSGMYLYKLETGSFTQTRKMTLIK